MQEILKPLDWPQNQREAKLETIEKVLFEFLKNPDYQNKEKLLAELDINDLNEFNSIGTVRITEYEIALINGLYENAKCMNNTSLVIYIYIHLYRITREIRMLSAAMGNVDMINDFFQKIKFLHTPLQLFSRTYFIFNSEKERTFAEQINYEIKKMIFNAESELLEMYEYCFISMMYDLSFVHSMDVFPILKFSRVELKSIFDTIATVVKKTENKITEGPLKEIMCVLLSNWILKSRNNYQSGPFYKYMDGNAVTSSVENHEIWMQKIKFLNDKREGNLIKDIFSNKTWIKYNWAKKVRLEKKHMAYVSSFSKSKPTNELIKEYGENYFGYKTDRIYNVISPLNDLGPVNLTFSQVMCYDVIYGQTEAKLELEYLFEIIDLFSISEEEKSDFLNSIIDYWILSFKDTKWENEQERRYELILHEGVNYFDLNIDNRFLKIKTSLFLYPDFVSKENKVKTILRENRLSKLCSISTVETLFCNECLISEVASLNHKKLCSNCGSEDIIII